MGIYEENLDLLNKRCPRLAGRLAGAEMQNLKIIEGKTGLPTIKVEGESSSWYLHSPYDPLREAETIVRRTASPDSPFHLILGTGMGYHILALYNHPEGRAKPAVIIEPDLNLLRVFLNTNVATLVLQSPHMYLAGGSLDEIDAELTKLINSVTGYRATNPAILVMPGFEKAYAGVYKEVLKIFSDRSKMKYFQIGNSAEDTLIGIRNTFDNIDYLLNSRGVNELRDSCRGLPAVIIAAGPSLDKNIHLLPEVKGKALILCVDTALSKVLKTGVVPDLVLTVERGAVVYDYFYHDTDMPEELWFAGLNVADRRIWAKFRNRSIAAFRSTEPLSIWLNRMAGDKGCLNAGMSVANLAMSVARLAGADPIIFMGQDLAYAPDGQTHARGTAYDSKKMASEPVVYVKDYNGNLIPSREIWKKFLLWFEDEIARTPGTTFIDCTEGGAYIRGTRVMPLAEAVKTFMQDSRITPIPALMERNATVQPGRYNDAIREIDSMIGVIDEVTGEIYDNLVTVNRVKSVLGADEPHFGKDDLDKIENDFNIFLGTMAAFPRSVLGFITQSVLAMTMTRLGRMGRMDDVGKIKEATETIAVYYSYLTEILDITRMVLEEGIEKIKACERARGGDGS